jgi:hypothetical protein
VQDVKGAAVIGLVLWKRRVMLKRAAVFVNLALEVKDVTDVWKTFMVFQETAAEVNGKLGCCCKNLVKIYHYLMTVIANCNVHEYAWMLVLTVYRR